MTKKTKNQKKGNNKIKKIKDKEREKMEKNTEKKGYMKRSENPKKRDKDKYKDKSVKK